MARPNIAKALKTSPATLHGRLTESCRNGYILKMPGNNPTMYHILKKGQVRIKDLEHSGIVTAMNNPNAKLGLGDLVALQKFSVKYPIIKMPDVYWGKLDDQVRNWIRGRSEWKNCIEIVTGIQTDDGTPTGKITTASSVIINVKMIIGENAHQLEKLAWEIVRTHAHMMEELGGYELGKDPAIIGKPEYEIASNLAKEEIEKYGWAKGVRDKSVFGGEYVLDTPAQVQSLKDLITLPGAINQGFQALLTELKAMNQNLTDLNTKADVQGAMMTQLAQANIQMATLLQKLTQPQPPAPPKPSENGDEGMFG